MKLQVCSCNSTVGRSNGLFYGLYRDFTEKWAVGVSEISYSRLFSSIGASCGFRDNSESGDSSDNTIINYLSGSCYLK